MLAEAGGISCAITGGIVSTVYSNPTLITKSLLFPTELLNACTARTFAPDNRCSRASKIG